MLCFSTNNNKKERKKEAKKKHHAFLTTMFTKEKEAHAFLILGYVVSISIV